MDEAPGDDGEGDEEEDGNDAADGGGESGTARRVGHGVECSAPGGYDGGVRLLPLLAVVLSACAPPEAPRGSVTITETPRPAGRPKAEPSAWQPSEGRELLGTPAPEFSGLSDWTRSEPLTLASLRGKVVLVRFWTTGCVLCRHTAPALNGLHRTRLDRGLVVVGVHHPKEPSARDAGFWRACADRYGFEFPLAQDQELATVNAWWLERGAGRTYTSATFLLDREGVIRWLHPGGEFFEGEGEPGEAYRSLVDEVDKLLG